MKLLKLILYIICFACMGWLILFFGGPSIIKLAASYHFSDQIRLENVRVTPKLDINIGRIELKLKSNKSQPEIKGSIRALSVSWSVFESNPFLLIKAGPTSFNDRFFLKTLEVSSPNFDSFNIEQIPINLIAQNAKVKDYANASTIKLEGRLENKFVRLVGLKVSISDLLAEPDGFGYFKNMKLKMTDISLNRPLVEQSVFIDFYGQEASSGQFSMDVLDINGSFHRKSKTNEVDLKLNSISMPTMDAVGNNVSAKVIFDDVGFSWPLELGLKSVTFINDKIKLEDVKLEFFLDNAKATRASIEGGISLENLSIDKFLIGEFPTSNFSAEIRSDHNFSEIRSTITFNMPSIQLASLNGKMTAKMLLENGDQKAGCSFTGCRIVELDIEYQFNVNDENITGTIFCRSFPCATETSSHKLVISNTAMLFNDLAVLRLFNPLVSAYLYSLFLSGEKYNNGHIVELEF